MNISKKYRIERAKREELPLVKEILAACQLPAHDLSEAHLQHFFLLRNQSEALGSVGLEIHGGCGLLRSLAVDEAHRGGGLGERLVRRIESHARDQGIGEIYLLTTTASGFFRSLGYTEVSREAVPEPLLNSEQFSGICPSTAPVLKKTITAN